MSKKRSPQKVVRVRFSHFVRGTEVEVQRVKWIEHGRAGWRWRDGDGNLYLDRQVERRTLA